MSVQQSPKKCGEWQHLEYTLLFITLLLAGVLTLQQNCQLPMLSFPIKPPRKHFSMAKFVIWYLYEIISGTALFISLFFLPAGQNIIKFVQK